ncbi:protein of unknown function [Candidatus Nitrotoga arctica]|uniref:Uncharacterized protein n=1 Tax=Candidatus Nitrotoga arctica TaxID=453162 RepID=A0ABM8YYA2_9PROT|nr:protein of unknown function [Candidatus Nitrotoga arctica]
MTGLIRDYFGPIPASAGETAKNVESRKQDRAYPRERGGNANGDGKGWKQQGLSPRARGKRNHVANANVNYGPIPASAGET